MTGEKVDFDPIATEARSNTDAPPRLQSTILFPNVDLEAAVRVARAVYDRRGLGTCPLDELAAEMGVTMSGSFRLGTSATRMFGFIEKDGLSAVKLTDLGSRLVSPESERDAKTTAFLNIPLYSQIHEKYRGKLLPPSKALEREMIALGVVANQADRARQVFQRSAKQAGFFDSGDDRLVRPKITGQQYEATDTLDHSAVDKPAAEPPPAEQRRSHGGGGSGSGGYHPFIEGLLKTLPAPDTVWTVEGRAAWLEAAASVFKLLYQGDGRITVTANSEQQQHKSGANH